MKIKFLYIKLVSKTSLNKVLSLVNILAVIYDIILNLYDLIKVAEILHNLFSFINFEKLLSIKSLHCYIPCYHLQSSLLLYQIQNILL